MNSDKRRLKLEFLEFLESRAITVKCYLVEKDMEMKKGSVYSLLKGKAMRTDVAVRFVTYVTDPSRDCSSPLCLAIRDFVLHETGQDIRIVTMSPQSIANVLLETESEDGLMGGIDRFLKFVTSPISILGTPMRCDGNHLSDAIKWMYIVAGRECKGRLTTNDAMSYYSKCIGLSAETYTQRALQWLRFDPWTVTLTRRQNRAAGMSIVLPINKATYDAIRSGQMTDYDIMPKDLKRPSRYLLLAGCAERPTDCDGPFADVSTSLHMSLMKQIAVLSYCESSNGGHPIHLLSFGATDENGRRLASAGFKQLQAAMPISGARMYEMVVVMDGRDMRSFITAALLEKLGKSGDTARPPELPS